MQTNHIDKSEPDSDGVPRVAQGFTHMVWSVNNI